MSRKPDFLEQASLSDIKRGYTYLRGKDAFLCLTCGKTFADGIIYPDGQQLYEAKKYVKIHIEKEHGQPFRTLLNLDKKWTGLTDHQKNIVKLFYEGHNDGDIAKALDIGSVSTIRNHRFSLREKQKQAKVFLAIMELLEEQTAKKETWTDSSAIPGPANNSFAVTREESEKVLKTYFRQGFDSPLESYPLKAKKQIIILRQLIKNFREGVQYTEKEVNNLLKKFYGDYVLLRRQLIDYGFMDRTQDGSSYWVKTAPAAPRNICKGVKIMSDRQKELKLAYKLNPPPMGVYQIRNQVNGKIFVSSSMNLPGKKNSFQFLLDLRKHPHQLNLKSHPNKGLQADWTTFGSEAFIFEVLETLKSEEIPEEERRKALAALEEKWLDKLQPYGETGYNKPPK